MPRRRIHLRGKSYKCPIIKLMKLIFALGNPEVRYSDTRHNTGFLLLEAYAGAHGLAWQHKDKFKADMTERSIEGEKVILAKPTTYYNLVGESARLIADFYKILPENILVVHDDIALPLGTIRTRMGGSDGGNNGMKSIIAHLGPDIKRVRIGVDSPRRQAMNDADFVLSKLSLDETKQLLELAPQVENLFLAFMENRFAPTTMRNNGQ